MEQKDNQINSQENIQEFEINKLVVEVHNKIAKWHNEEPNNLALKFLSLEIVEEVAGAAFKHLGLDYTEGLKMDDETKEKFKTAKNEANRNGRIYSDAKGLSDEELLKEIEKRKLRKL